jgi:hypothetical protein
VEVVVDDRLLIEELLAGIDRRGARLHTTAYWYFRACRAAVAGAGGHLSGPFRDLSVDEQQRAVATMLRLPDEIGLSPVRDVVPLMVRVAGRHPRLNLLNLEAVATAQLLQARVWLSPEGASGILPAVLDAEDVDWERVTPA